MAESVDSKYKGIPKSLYPQIRQQIGDRTGALKKAIAEQEEMLESARAKIQASIDELQDHLSEADDDLAFINKNDSE